MILNKLNLLERGITELLSSGTVSFALIESKLSEIESSVLELTDHFSLSELTSWHCKLAHWWCQYAQAVEGASLSQLNHLKPKKASSFDAKEKKCVQSKGDYSAFLRCNSSSLTGLSSSVFEDSSNTFDWVFRSYQSNSSFNANSSSTPFGPYASFLPAASSLSHFSDDELSELATFLENIPIEATVSPYYLQTVTEQLLEELSAVSSSGQKAIGTLKELLLTLCKGITAFAPYRSQSVAYDRHLFAVAFSKLTSEQRHHFTANYARDSVQLLSEYARHEIITYYSVRKRKVLAANMPDETSLPAEQTEGWQKLKLKLQLHQQRQLCRYCHEAYHSLKNCPVLKNILCFSCFNYGHSSKMCHFQAKGSEDPSLKVIAF
ncbi:hypothetical protein TYRP_019961 [Tyrophagus putrescentiae]|nr:hypothetical protein TYRP_019961 [Tyrophagus putrescentiae]